MLEGNVAKLPLPNTYCPVVPANISLPTREILALKALPLTVVEVGTKPESEPDVINPLSLTKSDVLTGIVGLAVKSA